MNRRHSNLRSALTLSLALLLNAACPPLAAAEIGLRPYHATYDMYYGGMHVAITELALLRKDQQWSWHTLTRARGIYSIFTDKEPFAAALFSLNGSTPLLSELRFSDYGDDRHYETARFDWEGGRMKVLRKGKHWEVDLGAGVYDYQSIHLLAAEMQRAHQKTSTVDFYRKGKLVKSRVVYSGRDTVSIDGKQFEAEVFELVVSKSSGKVKYYYDTENPLLPLRVERLEAGESPSIMTLREVHWDL
jgi:hypothetical protein